MPGTPRTLGTPNRAVLQERIGVGVLDLGGLEPLESVARLTQITTTNGSLAASSTSHACLWPYTGHNWILMTSPLDSVASRRARIGEAIPCVLVDLGVRAGRGFLKCAGLHPVDLSN
jgi:hypothetical protein